MVIYRDFFDDFHRRLLGLVIFKEAQRRLRQFAPKAPVASGPESHRLERRARAPASRARTAPDQTTWVE